MKKEKQENMVFLPEAIIQHIQSFMNKKEAFRTSLLSKSWYDAWLTRPDLDFIILPSSNLHEFQEFANKTFRRYRDSNRKIESFALTMHIRPSNPKVNPGIVDMIDNATKLGATRLKLNLKIRENPPFLLWLDPRNLDSLSVENCRVEVDSRHSCSTMKSLSLKSASVDHVFVLTLSCIEELSLSNCRGVRLDWFESRKLRHLSLESMEVPPNFFVGFSDKFPCLNTLILIHCDIREQIRIESTSIEEIVYSPFFQSFPSFPAKFEVPNIRKFSSTNVIIPSCLFIEVPSSREWEFDANLRRRRDELQVWFLLVTSIYLTRLARVCGVRICLSLHIEDGGSHEHGSKDFEECILGHMPRNPVVVKSLSTNLDEECMDCYHFFSRLFEVENC